MLAKVFASSYTKQVAKSGGQILHRKTSGTATGFGDFGFGDFKNLLKIAAKNFLKKFLTKRSAGANIYRLTRTGRRSRLHHEIKDFGDSCMRPSNVSGCTLFADRRDRSSKDEANDCNMSQELQLLRVSAGDYDPTAESRKWNPPLREAGDIWLMLYLPVLRKGLAFSFLTVPLRLSFN